MARFFRALMVATMATGLAAPALVHGQPVQGNWPSGYPGAYQGTWQGQWQGQWQPQPGQAQQGAMQPPQGAYPAAPMSYGPPPAEADPRYREMVEKCQNVGRRHSGTTGAVIGGVVGGVVGNRVASGNRVLGTVAGAAVGAAAGGAIGHSVDKNRERECDEFFSSYAPAPGYGPAPYPGVFPYGGYAPANGYPAYGYPAYGYVMVPVMTVQGPQQPCVETRTETVTYVRERVRRPWRPVRTKLIKEKRVYTGS